MISIVMPVLNEEAALPATLARTLDRKARFELIVVDGGSSDGTVELVEHVCRQDNRVTLLTAATGRARQMNAGALLATGDWLLFLHADTLLPALALTHIALLPPEVQAGGFTHRFSGQASGLQLVSWLHNFRWRCTRVVYGDQALFVRKSLFESLGGFPDTPRLEDLLFGEQLAAVTKPVLLQDAVITDSRKFEQAGVWTSLWRVLLILLRHRLKRPIPALRFFDNIR